MSERRQIGTTETQTERETQTAADTSGTAAETSETQTLPALEGHSFFCRLFRMSSRKLGSTSAVLFCPRLSAQCPRPSAFLQFLVLIFPNLDGTGATAPTRAKAPGFLMRVAA